MCKKYVRAKRQFWDPQEVGVLVCILVCIALIANGVETNDKATSQRDLKNNRRLTNGTSKAGCHIAT